MTGATEAVRLPVEPDETVAVWFADFCAEPPPNVSTDASALVREIWPWMPPATEALMSPSSVRATQITEYVPDASAPPVVAAVTVGVGVVPSASWRLPPRMICSSAIISDHKSVVPAIERTSSKPIAAYSASQSMFASRPMPL